MREVAMTIKVYLVSDTHVAPIFRALDGILPRVFALVMCYFLRWEIEVKLSSPILHGDKNGIDKY